MKSLKRILSVIMVLTMLLSSMGSIPFEAAAEQAEQEGVTVSDVLEVESVPSEPAPAPAEEPAPAPAEEPAPAPAEEATDAPVKEAADAPVEEAADAPVEDAADAPVEDAADAPVEEATDTPAEEATDAPAEEATDAPAEEATAEPEQEEAAEATAAPEEEPTAEATAAPEEEPAAEATAAPEEEPAAEPTAAPEQAPAAGPAEGPSAEIVGTPDAAPADGADNEPADEPEAEEVPVDEPEEEEESEDEEEPEEEPAEEEEEPAEDEIAATMALDSVMPIDAPGLPEGTTPATGVTWTIGKNGDYTIPYDGQQIVDGDDVQATCTDSTLSGPTYKYAKDVDGTPQQLETNPTNAGVYYVTATWTTDSGSVGATQRFEITALSLTVTCTEQEISKDYKGSAYKGAELGLSIKVEGAVSGETIEANAVIGEDDSAINVSDSPYPVNYTLSYDTADEKNYQAPEPSPIAQLTITKKQGVSLALKGGASSAEYTGEGIVLTADKFDTPKLAEGDTLVSVTLGGVVEPKEGGYTGQELKVTAIQATRDGGPEIDVTANYDLTKFTLTGTLTVEPKKLDPTAVQVIEEKDYPTYDGQKHEVQPTIQVGDNVVLEGQNAQGEFTFEYDPQNPLDAGKEPINAGVVQVKVTPKEGGHYTFDGEESVTREYTIKPKDLTPEDVVKVTVDPVAPKTYTGSELTPGVTVYDNGRQQNLVPKPDDQDGGDYTVAYADNINAGTARVTITGIGNYTGSRTVNFTINPKSLEADGAVKVELGSTTMTYTGSELEPGVTVYDNDRQKDLDEQLDGQDGGDYTVAYTNNINANVNSEEKATVTITGIGNYTGSRAVEFTINPKSLTADGIYVDDIEDVVYNGKPQEPAVVVYDKEWSTETPLEPDSDYTVAYADNTNAGTATVTITGMGNYTGTIDPPPTFTIKKISLTITSGTGSKEYDGTPLTVENVEVTEGAFAPGEGATYDNFSSRTIVGTSENKFTYTLTENTDSDNYAIETVYGTLKVTERSELYAFTITAQSDDQVYDGQEHTVSGFVGNDKVTIGTDGTITVTELVGETSVRYTVEGLSASAAGIDADSYPSKVVGKAVVKDENGNDVTDQFKVYPVDGVLTINKKNLSDSDVACPELPTVIYNGTAYRPKPVVTYTSAGLTLQEGEDFDVLYDDNIAAGTATVTVTADQEKKNYTGHFDLSFEIEKQSLDPANGSTVSAEASWKDFADTFTINTETEAGFVYDGDEHKWVPSVTYMQGYVKDVAEGESVELPQDEYTVSYTRGDQTTEDFTNAGTITVTIAAKENSNFKDSISFEYTIARKPLTVTAKGEKLFGAVDPKFAIGVTAAAAEKHDADNWLMIKFDGIVTGEEGLFDGDGVDDALTVTAKRVPGEAKEQPGKYGIAVTVDAEKAVNYVVTNINSDEGEFTDKGTFIIPDSFTIKDTAAFTVTLGDTKDAGDINTHTGSVAYAISAKPRQELIDDLQTYITATLNVKVGNRHYAAEDRSAKNPNIPETIQQDTRAKNDPDKQGSFTIPRVAYSATIDGHTPLTWQSGLPAGTTLTVTVASKTEPKASATSLEDDGKVVVAPNADLVSDYNHNTTGTYLEDGDPHDGGRAIMDANGYVTIAPNPNDNPYIGNDDWVALTVGGRTYYYSVDHQQELPAGASINRDRTLTLNLDALKTLAGYSGSEGGWFGVNPTEQLTVRAVLFDGENHTAGSTTVNVAFDTGAMDSTQTVENRITAESLQLAITDSVNANANVNVSGQFGGVAITGDIAAVGGVAGTLTWNNVTKWMQTPATLPHSGDTITINYLDCVGNQVKHTLTVGRSAAVTPNTLYVQPMKNDTVPGKSLTFYGETNVWEQGVLTVGGTTFPVEPIPGSENYDNGTKRWQTVINLGDINFPVGEPTTVSMAYEDLTGGEATIRITYKDQAQTPILSSEPVVGSQALWGYVESGATVSVSIYHTDGSITQIPQNNIAVDQFGFYYVRLNSPLNEGEQVTVSTSDFCDNQKSITAGVQKELNDYAVAEVLGANIIDELRGTNNIQHRFATPIDLGELAQSENKTLTLPILAYKSIEIGKVTFSLMSPGKLTMNYTIKATNSIPVGATARMRTFAAAPTIDDLVGGEMSTVVKDLKAAPMGSIPAVDLSAYQTGDGSYSGVIWLQFAFDVDMTEDNFVSRGGRDARFYRWLTESLQTEDLLGAVYQETAAYTDNMGYYNQYQKFENIYKMN